MMSSIYWLSAGTWGIFLLGELVQAPVLVHAVVQKVLVDGREFVFELGLQMANDLCVAFHGELLVIKTALWPAVGGVDTFGAGKFLEAHVMKMDFEMRMIRIY